VGELDTSNLASVVVVDIANQYIDPIGDPVGVYRVDRIEYDVENPIAVKLWWGGVPTGFASVEGSGVIDAESLYGGIFNNEPANVRDGRILATTTGYVSGVISFALTLRLVKQAFVKTGIGGGFILMEDNVSYVLMEDGVSKIKLE
jgi:hypothetical protein